jgi:hypothetical protein
VESWLRCQDLIVICQNHNVSHFSNNLVTQLSWAHRWIRRCEIKD